MSACIAYIITGPGGTYTPACERHARPWRGPTTYLRDTAETYRRAHDEYEHRRRDLPAGMPEEQGALF